MSVCFFFFLRLVLLVFFFFQAEDGIRDADVTGVQTCALPIWVRAVLRYVVLAARLGRVELAIPLPPLAARDFAAQRSSTRGTTIWEALSGCPPSGGAPLSHLER